VAPFAVVRVQARDEIASDYSTRSSQRGGFSANDGEGDARRDGPLPQPLPHEGRGAGKRDDSSVVRVRCSARDVGVRFRFLPLLRFIQPLSGEFKGSCA
jgi:hypothetical protein